MLYFIQINKNTKHNKYIILDRLQQNNGFKVLNKRKFQRVRRQISVIPSQYSYSDIFSPRYKNFNLKIFPSSSRNFLFFSSGGNLLGWHVLIENANSSLRNIIFLKLSKSWVEKSLQICASSRTHLMFLCRRFGRKSSKYPSKLG